MAVGEAIWLVKVHNWAASGATPAFPGFLKTVANSSGQQSRNNHGGRSGRRVLMSLFQFDEAVFITHVCGFVFKSSCPLTITSVITNTVPGWPQFGQSGIADFSAWVGRA